MIVDGSVDELQTDRRHSALRFQQIEVTEFSSAVTGFDIEMNFLGDGNAFAFQLIAFLVRAGEPLIGGGELAGERHFGGMSLRLNFGQAVVCFFDGTLIAIEHRKWNNCRGNKSMITVSTEAAVAGADGDIGNGGGAFPFHQRCLTVGFGLKAQQIRMLGQARGKHVERRRCCPIIDDGNSVGKARLRRAPRRSQLSSRADPLALKSGQDQPCIRERESRPGGFHRS